MSDKQERARKRAASLDENMSAPRAGLRGRELRTIEGDGDALRIAALHSDALSMLNNALGNAIEIGAILARVKREKRGGYDRWIEENLPFTTRTARTYVRMYEHREEIQEAGLSSLQDATRFLSGPAEAAPQDQARQLYKAFRRGESLKAPERRILREYLSGLLASIDEKRKALRADIGALE